MVAKYIANADPAQRKALRQIRAIIRRVVPKTTERISYGIPTFDFEGKPLLYMAAFREHVSVYPVTRAMAVKHGKAIEPYRHGRGTLRFSLDDKLPIGLIEKLTKTRLQERRAGAR